MSNPVVNNFNQFNHPFANSSLNVMTVDGVVNKSAGLLFALFVGVVFGWFNHVFMIPTVLIAFVLALVISFWDAAPAWLIWGYSILEGVALGALSGVMDLRYPGVVSQALLATVVVFAVTFVLFKSGKIRTSPKLNKIFFIALVSYFVFSLVNLVLMLTGVVANPWGLRGMEIFGLPLGAVLGVLVVIMAAYSLVVDFESIESGVNSKLPKRYEWRAAFGLLVTTVWLYVELLRLFAILRK